MLDFSVLIFYVLLLIEAALGALLLFILFHFLSLVKENTKLKRFRSKEPSFVDLLNYACVVEDGVIVCKDGALMAAWLYQGADDSSFLDEQKEMVSFRINQALSSLGSGWALHVDAVRRPAPGYPGEDLSHFPDPVTRALDNERRAFFEEYGKLYQGYFVLTLSWLPPLLVQRRFIEMMFDDETKKEQPPTEGTKALLEMFRREISSVEVHLSSIFKMTRLRAQKVQQEDGSVVVYDDFLSWLRFCVTGVHAPVLLPDHPAFIDALLGAQDTWTGIVPRTGRKFVQVVSIDGFPLQSAPGMLSNMSEIAAQYRWSSRFIFMDPHEAIDHLEKFRKKWRQKVRGFFDQVFNTSMGPVDQNALMMMQDAENAIGEVNSGTTGMGYYTSVVVLMHEDRAVLEKMSVEIEKAIAKMGFGARIETINTMDAWIGSFPGHVVENVRRPLLTTMNLSDLLPVKSIWSGNAVAPCPLYPPLSPSLMQCITAGGTPFHFNLHLRDLGHSFMFGPTGSGKSIHLGMIAAQLRRYKGMSVYVFDKGFSMYALTKAIGGKHFSCGADDSTLSFCPLQFLDSRADRAFAMEWVDSILRLNGIETTPAHRNAISEAIESMSASGAKTLSEFCLTMQNEDIREALRQYTIDGSMGHLLDAEVDGLSLSSFNTFEIEDLMNLGEKYALPVLLYLFRRIESSLKGQPAAIILDEAWIMLGHAVFRERIREWLKVLRKSNCLVLMATQSISDAANSGILDVIVESTATKIFLPNSHAREEESAHLYRMMGLNARQRDIIASALPKKQYYYVGEEGQRLYEMALGPLALALLGASDKESLATIKQYEHLYGEEWLRHWLHKKGLGHMVFACTTPMGGGE